MVTPVFVHRPEDGVHPPAAGLDPQLSPGGAEVIVSAGRLGQDVSATLRQQELVTGPPPRLTPSVHTVRGWTFIAMMMHYTPAEGQGLDLEAIWSVNATCGHWLKMGQKLNCVWGN